MKKPKILLYDIERTPNLAYVWGKWQQDVLAYKNEQELLSFAYKWLGDKKVSYESRKGLKTDVSLVHTLADLLDEADIVVAHNGDEFDRKVVKTRMLYWGLGPLKTNCSVDTRKVAKTYFEFNGNGLDDLCKFLGIGQKLKNPGIDMWLGCMKDSNKSWKQMEFYNKRDVVLLEKLYKRFLPWIENHPNISRLLNPAIRGVCPQCSSKHVQKRGLKATAKAVHQHWQCQSCTKWFYTTR